MTPDLSRLPEGCVAHVLSLTSPQDACVASAVSRSFYSAAGSDVVWERFLPPDYEGIIARAVDQVAFSSRKELFARLCRPLLVDGGRKNLVLVKSTGRKCFMLSARELWIAWGDSPLYWNWTSHPESRFSEVATLWNVCWLEITGRLETAELSPKTTYVAYFIFKLIPGHHRGFDNRSQEAHVIMETQISRNNVSLMARNGRRLARSDGWMELAMGEFFNDDGRGEVAVRLKEVDDYNWKGGLIVEGIEFRPKNQ